MKLGKLDISNEQILQYVFTGLILVAGLVEFYLDGVKEDEQPSEETKSKRSPRARKKKNSVERTTRRRSNAKFIGKVSDL